MTKSTTMVTDNVFRFTRLFGKRSSNIVLFPLQLMTLRSYMTNYTQLWQVETNLDPSKTLVWDLNRGFDLIAFLSTFWFLLCGGIYTDLSLKVELTIGTKSGTTTWLQQIFSSFLVIGSAIKHIACILRD